MIFGHKAWDNGFGLLRGLQEAVKGRINTPVFICNGCFVGWPSRPDGRQINMVCEHGEYCFFLFYPKKGEICLTICLVFKILICYNTK